MGNQSDLQFQTFRVGGVLGSKIPNFHCYDFYILNKIYIFKMIICFSMLIYLVLVTFSYFLVYDRMDHRLVIVHFSYA